MNFRFKIKKKFLILVIFFIITFLLTPTALATLWLTPPRARNYGFTNVVGSYDAALNATNIQDSVGYDGLCLVNNPAHYAYNNMYQNAVYTFNGHGLWVTYPGAGEYFYNTYTSIYPTSTYFRTGSGTNTSSTVWLNNLASASFADMLLALNTGCSTAYTHPTYGNFTYTMYLKGCNTAIGFRGDILDFCANYWQKQFFYYAKLGYTFGGCAYYAAMYTNSYYGTYGGVDTYQLYGNYYTKLIPARYGS